MEIVVFGYLELQLKCKLLSKTLLNINLLFMKTKLHYLIIALIFGFFANAQVSITGTGTGGWNQPGNLPLTSTDGVNWTASNFEIVGDANMKFSEAGTWETTGGYSSGTTAPGFPGGTVTINGGSNIVGTLGFWNVTYNTVTKDYLFTPGVNPNPVIKINGGGLTAPVQMNTSNGIAYAKKSLFFAGGDVSFTQEGTSNQWGGGFPDGPVVNGATIPVPVGAFNTYFVMPTLVGPAEYIFEPVVVSMIGNFSGSGWGTDLDLQTTDNVHFTISNWTPVINGDWTDTEMHLKFRDNHDWSTQYGCNAGGNGSNNLALIGTSQNGVDGGGGDIFIPWGPTYNVDFNRATGEWTFTDTLSTATYSNTKFSVYPNPTNNSWTFSSKDNAQITSIQIVDVLGKVVTATAAASNQINVDASSLNAGVYFATVNSANATQTIKLVKN